MKSIFVSSTFIDMQNERDVLHSKVFPQLNSIAREYGDHIEGCDLRWGINTTQMSESDSSKKILKVCFDEIDRCRPYMIVLVGNRYGWIPQKSDLESVKHLNSSLDGLKEVSVTELEIQYGALLRQDNLNNVLFYFREIEDEAYDEIYSEENHFHREKLAQLKRKIMNTPGVHYRTYRVKSARDIPMAMEHFAEMVFQDLKQLFSSEWKNQSELDEYQIDQIGQNNNMIQSSNMFAARNELLDKCISLLKVNHKVYLQGCTGIGKSTLVSKIGCVLKSEEFEIIPVFCGFSSLCTSGYQVLQYLVYCLETKLQRTNHFGQENERTFSLKDWYKKIDELLVEYDIRQKRNLVILIDGIDQLMQDEVCTMLGFLSRREYKHIFYLLSSTKESDKLAGISEIKISELTEKEVDQVIHNILISQHRELPSTVIEVIKRKKESAIPLYLNLLIQRLLMMNQEDFNYIRSMGAGIEAITDYQIQLIDQCPESLNEVGVFILKHAASIMDKTSVNRILEYLAVSRQGLRMTDIEELMEADHMVWNKIDFISFMQYMSMAFIIRGDGRIDFSHQSIRTGFLSICRNESEIHQKIAIYFYGKDEQDDIRATELIWHLMKADMMIEFAETIANYSHIKRIAESVVRDVVSQAIMDQGRWLIEVIKEICFQPVFGYLSHFLSYNVFFAIPDSTRNLNLKVAISKILLEAAQKRCTVMECHANIWEITICCDRLGNIYQNYETEEAYKKAAAYYNNSLRIRNQMYDNIHSLSDIHEYREYIETNLRGTGLAVEQYIPDDAIMQLIDGLLLEVIRGIGVAHKDLAMILEHIDGEIDAALAHINEGIRVADFLHDYSDRLVSDAYLDQMLLRTIKSHICMKIGGRENEQMALVVLEEAKDLCLDKIRNENRMDMLNVLYGIWIDIADYYEKKEDPDIKKGISICNNILPEVEKRYFENKTSESAHTLVLLYDRMGNMYSRGNTVDDKKMAEYYTRKCLELQKYLSSINDSIDEKRNLSLASEKSAEALLAANNDQGISAAEMFRTSYEEAQSVFMELKSKEACERINWVLDTIIRWIKSYKKIDSKVKDLIITRLRIKQMHHETMCIDWALSTNQSIIIKLNEAADTLSEFKPTDKVELPTEIQEILSSVDIDGNTMWENLEDQGFYLSERALAYAEILMEKNPQDTLVKDTLAVSLSKFTSKCMMRDPYKFDKYNNRLLEVLDDLQNEKNSEKYMLMRTMANMGKMIGARLTNKKDAPTDDDLGKFLHDTFGI